MKLPLRSCGIHQSIIFVGGQDDGGRLTALGNFFGASGERFIDRGTNLFLASCRVHIFASIYQAR